MFNVLYSIPFITALVAYLTTFLTVKLLFQSYQSRTVADKLIHSLIQKLKEMDLQSDLDHLLEKHLIEFIATLKQQIPMASMFLSGSTSERLKKQAKEEFMKMLPELKEKIWQRFSTNLSFVENMIKESVFKRMCRISFIAAGLGFLIGLLELFLIMAF